MIGLSDSEEGELADVLWRKAPHLPTEPTGGTSGSPNDVVIEECIILLVEQRRKWDLIRTTRLAIRLSIPGIRMTVCLLRGTSFAHELTDNWLNTISSEDDIRELRSLNSWLQIADHECQQAFLGASAQTVACSE